MSIEKVISQWERSHNTALNRRIHDLLVNTLENKTDPWADEIMKQDSVPVFNLMMMSLCSGIINEVNLKEAENAKNPAPILIRYPVTEIILRKPEYYSLIYPMISAWCVGGVMKFEFNKSNVTNRDNGNKLKKHIHEGLIVRKKGNIMFVHDLLRRWNKARFDIPPYGLSEEEFKRQGFILRRFGMTPTEP